jgi:3-hydroxyacyl-CoA dehydrogenase/enoyl-CoA hydratase/3-hydroxybutyryl-CoA epimerase
MTDLTRFNDFRHFRVTCDPRGVLTAALDVAGMPYNVFNEAVVAELESLVTQLESEPAVRMAVFTSGKDSGFLAGGDVREISSIRVPWTAEQVVLVGQQLFDRVEGLPMPTLAVIHGPCLGGGLEFALSCRYRLAQDDEHTRLGFPEIELGLLPGWGGTQRLPRRVGLTAALQMILTGRKVSAREAAGLGLVDGVSPPDRFGRDVEDFVSERLAEEPLSRRRPGLVERFRDRTRLGRRLVLRATRRQIAPRARHYPALTAALEAVERGLAAGRAAGLARERETFAELLFTPTCRRLMDLFFSRERARKPGTWVDEKSCTPGSIRRVAVIGAGAMGTGIAQLAAYRGLEVLLNDVDEKALAAGMTRITQLTEKAVGKGLLHRDDAAARLRNVTSRVGLDGVADVDLAVEAVPEREGLKLQVLRRLDERLRPEAIVATNTSSLSVGRLAEATGRPGQVAGLHFFNPVHRMQLVEVVRAPGTSDHTIATLVELVRSLGKVPLVVADGPGFLVNRILFPYLDEAVRMVSEGTPPDEIDREMRRFGMPMGPLQLLDHVGIDVAADVAQTLSAETRDPGPTPQWLSEMALRGWTGRKSGRGFYRYRGGRRGKPVRWDRRFSQGTSSPAASRAARDDRRSEDGSGPRLRLVYATVNEAARCLEQKIVPAPWMVDLGMVLGTGFAPFRGGPLRWADQVGLERVVSDLQQLERACGKRFSPCTLLREMGAAGLQFYPEAEEQAAAAKKRDDNARRLQSAGVGYSHILVSAQQRVNEE